MDAFIVITLVAVFLLAVVAAIVADYRMEKKRTEEFRAIAGRLGLQFVGESAPDQMAQWNGLHLFDQGRSRSIRNLLQGEVEGSRVAVFDYRFTVGSGKNSHTYRQTVCAFEDARLQLPGFELRPESFWHRIGGLFGYQDVDFEEQPEFSKRYLLRGSDEGGIRALFRRDILEHYETREGLCTEAKGARLIVYRAAKRVPTAEVEMFLREGLALLVLFSRR